MQALIDSLRCIISWLGDSFVQLFVDLFEVVSDLAVFLFDEAGQLVLSAFASFDWAWLGDAGTFWYQLPSLAIQIASAIGLPQAFAIVLAGALVRFVLQLIPFVRLGS